MCVVTSALSSFTGIPHNFQYIESIVTVEHFKTRREDDSDCRTHRKMQMGNWSLCICDMKTLISHNWFHLLNVSFYTNCTPISLQTGKIHSLVSFHNGQFRAYFGGWRELFWTGEHLRLFTTGLYNIRIKHAFNVQWTVATIV